jgi:hypothetical protein
MAMLSTGALGFMRENSKDFELGAMLPAKEQRAVPIGGASLVRASTTRRKSGVSVPDIW